MTVQQEVANGRVLLFSLSSPETIAVTSELQDRSRCRVGTLGCGTSEMLPFVPCTVVCSEAQFMRFHEMALEAVKFSLLTFMKEGVPPWKFYCMI